MGLHGSGRRSAAIDGGHLVVGVVEKRMRPKMVTCALHMGSPFLLLCPAILFWPCHSKSLVFRLSLSLSLPISQLSSSLLESRSATNEIQWSDQDGPCLPQCRLRPRGLRPAAVCLGSSPPPRSLFPLRPPPLLHAFSPTSVGHPGRSPLASSRRAVLARRGRGGGRRGGGRTISGRAPRTNDIAPFRARPRFC